MRTRLRALFVAALTLLALVTVAPAATTQPRDDQEEAHRPRRFKRIRDRLLRNKVGLSDEKAEAVTGIFSEHEAERREIQGELRTAQKSLRELLKSDSDDQESYAVALASLAEANKDLQTLRDQELAALQQILTPKEQAKLLRAMVQVKRRLNARMR